MVVLSERRRLVLQQSGYLLARIVVLSSEELIHRVSDEMF